MRFEGRWPIVYRTRSRRSAMTEVDVVANVIRPWFEEIQGEKFAAMDARMCAVEVLAALNERRRTAQHP